MAQHNNIFWANVSKTMSIITLPEMEYSLLIYSVSVINSMKDFPYFIPLNPPRNLMS